MAADHHPSLPAADLAQGLTFISPKCSGFCTSCAWITLSPVSLPVVITPLTVTVATTELEEAQLKFPLPPWAWGGKPSSGQPTCLSLGPSLSHTQSASRHHVVTCGISQRLAGTASAPRSPHPVSFWSSYSGDLVAYTCVCKCPMTVAPGPRGTSRAQAGMGRPAPQSRVWDSASLPTPDIDPCPLRVICREVKDSTEASRPGATIPGT